ncbi:MAG: DUF4065 domain-containing protein [Desulfovibrio sp.]|jgi:uncharacterized phage-associated protein|nr:DUF4065 domain-containing protein [Desulfovibrio sp.]
MATAIDVARYFLAVAPKDTVTHTKLQKLVAYAQGISLGMTGLTLYEESILAWAQGPVIREVMDAFEK